MAHSKLIVLNHIKKVYDSFPVKTITADDGSVKKKIDWYAIAMEKKYFGWRSFFIVLFYLSCGVLWYCIRDGWGFVDALYFSIVTVTTVGYGDETPEGDAAKVFTVFYMLVGVFIIGNIFAVLTDNAYEAQMKALKKSDSEKDEKFLRTFDEIDDDELSSKEIKIEPTWSDLWERILIFVLMILLFIMACAIELFVYQKVDNTWNCSDGNAPSAAPSSSINNFNLNPDPFTVIDLLYFVAATLTTIGYGDVSFKSAQGRLFAIFFLPLGVFSIGSLVGEIVGWESERRHMMRQFKMVSRGLNLRDLNVMDIDNNNKVDKIEFLQFVLVQTNKVEKQYFDRLKSQFRRLDKDRSGYLDTNDLKDIAERSQNSPMYQIQRYPSIKLNFNNSEGFKERFKNVFKGTAEQQNEILANLSPDQIADITEIFNRTDANYDADAEFSEITGILNRANSNYVDDDVEDVKVDDLEMGQNALSGKMHSEEFE